MSGSYTLRRVPRREGGAVIKVIVLYRERPEEEAYAEHVELCRREVPSARVSHGKVFPPPAGDHDFRYAFEFAFDDMDAFEAAQEELGRTADDAQRLGVPFTVVVANVA
jgi:hypothetical protein